MKFHEQVIVLTGISSGIGFFLSHLLANDNHTVYGILRNVDKFHKNVEKYKMQFKENLKIVSMDIRNYDKGKQLIDEIITKHQRIDVLINNAGYGLYGAFEEFHEKDFREQIETNFFAPVMYTKMVLPIMRKNSYGKIVNIASILGKLTIPTGTAYCSSKHALVAFTESLRYEVAHFGIQVCSVEPGLIETDFKANMKFSVDLDDENSPYYTLNQKIKEQLTKYPSFTTKAEIAAKKIYELLNRDFLPAHYQIGIDASFYQNLKTLLPENFIDFFMRNYVKSIFK